MDTSFLQSLQSWLKKSSEGSKNTFWLLKADGGKVFNNIKVSEFAPSWQMLEEMVIQQAINGKRVFEVTFKASSTDGTGTKWTVEAPYNFRAMAQQTGGAIGSTTVAAPVMQNNDAIWAERLNRMEDKFQHKLDLMERDNEISDLQGMISGIREDNRAGLDKTIDRFERVIDMLRPEIGKMVSGFFPEMRISGGGAAIAPPKSAPKVAATQDTEPVDTVEETEEEQSGGVDFNGAIQANLELMQAGFDEPGHIILTAARALIKNPDLIKYLQ